MTQVAMLIGVDDKKASIQAVAAELIARGLNNVHSMPHVGVITGDADATKLDEFSQVNGVRSIRPEGSFQLPPVQDNIPQ